MSYGNCIMFLFFSFSFFFKSQRKKCIDLSSSIPNCGAPASWECWSSGGPGHTRSHCSCFLTRPVFFLVNLRLQKRSLFEFTWCPLLQPDQSVCFITIRLARHFMMLPGAYRPLHGIAVGIVKMLILFQTPLKTCRERSRGGEYVLNMT